MATDPSPPPSAKPLAVLHPQHKNNLHGCDTGRPQRALALDSAWLHMFELSCTRWPSLAVAGGHRPSALCQSNVCNASLAARWHRRPQRKRLIGAASGPLFAEAWPAPKVGTSVSVFFSAPDGSGHHHAGDHARTRTVAWASSSRGSRRAPQSAGLLAIALIVARVYCGNCGNVHSSLQVVLQPWRFAVLAHQSEAKRQGCLSGRQLGRPFSFRS